jgi:hypothetical protein
MVEVVGQRIRYAGSDDEAALSALLTIDIDRGEEGYVVAEHPTAPISYCRAESERIENEAIKVRGDMAAKWMSAVETFHGEGPYVLANQGW